VRRKIKLDDYYFWGILVILEVSKIFFFNFILKVFGLFWSFW
jgi:hypothetical protein